MHAGNGPVHGMLQDARLARQSVERLLQVILQRHLIQMAVVHPVQLLQCFQLFDEAIPHVRRKVEIECRNRLPAMHLVLGGFQRNTTQDAGRFDAFCRP